MKPDIREQIFKEMPYCFRCGSYANLEWHHGIITKTKRIKKYLDVAENGITMCHNCNVERKGFIENFEFRNLVFNFKIRRGYDMFGWLESLPIKVKDKFYQLTNEEYDGLLKELTFRK